MALLESKWIGDIFEQETPAGLINGSNTVFTLSSIPHSPKSVLVFVNGFFQRQGLEYTISNDTITMTAAPASGSDIFAFFVKG